MNLGGISDQLPTYPNTIQGELRLILQTKDIFLVCYKHLEEYRKLVNEQNRLITKEFVQEQLQIGEDEISELKMEMQDSESRLQSRLRHNELLADHLAGLGFASLENGASIRHLALCRSPQQRKNMLSQRQATLNESRPATHMIDNIALAISEIQQEVRAKVKPLLDYYRDLFYLQLHFSLVLSQVCNYCMPLVTENISLIDRVFFWSERPEFDLIRRAGDISDRLKEIYTRAQTVLSVLTESVRFLQSKVELQKTMEQRFHERLDEQQKTKDKILREVHGSKQSMDTLEEENDRLVGSLVKVDPGFVDSRHFTELAEGLNPGLKKSPSANKDFGQHNVDTKGSMRADTFAERRVTELTSSGSLDANNNKAASVVGEDIIAAETQENASAANQELHTLLKDIKAKLSVEPKPIRRRSSHKVEQVEGDEVSTDQHSANMASRDTTPTPRRKKRSSSKSRTKVGRSESQNDRVKKPSKRSNHESKRRRSTSEEKKEHHREKKVRSKSSLGVRHQSEYPRQPSSERAEQFRPVSSASSSPSSAGTESPIRESPARTIKSKLLGRTRNILDAAMRRPGKVDMQSYQAANQESTFETNDPAPDDANNEGVTSVSSFASVMMSDSPIISDGEKHLPARHMRTLEPKSPGKPKKLSKSGIRKQKHLSNNFADSPLDALPSLTSDKLLIEDLPTKTKPRRDSTPKSSRKSQRRSTEGDLVNFLANTSLGDAEESSSATPASSLPPLF